MKRIIFALSFLSFGAIQAYEPFDYKKWERGFMQDINETFDRADRNYQMNESNRIQTEILKEIQRQNRSGIYQYGR